MTPGLDARVAPQWKAVAKRLCQLDVNMLQEWEWLDALSYDERRVIAVTLCKRDYEPRFATDWAFDLTGWDSTRTTSHE